MKKTLVIAASLAGAVGAFAQGTVNFSDLASVTATVYAPNPANPSVQTTGNTPTDSPAGSTTYAGQAIGGSATGTGSTSYGNGNNFTAELFGAAGSALAFSQLSPLTQYQSTFFTSQAGAGIFLGASPNPDPGISGVSAITSSATLSLAAWYNGGGTITSLAAAEAAGVPYGWSTPFTLSGLGNLGAPPSTPPDLTGLTSFSLITPSGTPEPGTITLGLMGAAAFFARRRKQQ